MNSTSIEFRNNSSVTVSVGVVSASTPTKSYFIIKQNLSDTDASALLTKTITQTPGAQGVILPTSGSYSAYANFYFQPTDFNALPLNSSLVWVFKEIDSNGPNVGLDGVGNCTVLNAGWDALT